MPQKRSRPSAFDKVLQEAQPVSQQNSSTVPLQDDVTVEPQSSSPAKKQNRVMLYLTNEQVDKLEDYAYEHRKRTGTRTNLNDIMRHLIDSSTSSSFDEL